MTSFGGMRSAFCGGTMTVLKPEVFRTTCTGSVCTVIQILAMLKMIRININFKLGDNFGILYITSKYPIQRYINILVPCNT
jgi:hypothetical protein